MRIVNHTSIETADLAALIRRVAEDELDPGQLKGTEWVVCWRKSKHAREAVYRRNNYPRTPGLKYNRAQLSLYREPGRFVRDADGHIAIDAQGNWKRGPKGAVDHQYAALVIAHEMAEMRGRSHEEMRSPRYFTTRHQQGKPGRWREVYAWAKEMPLREKAKPEKMPIGDRRRKQLTHAHAMVKKWESREKRTKTMLRKWRTRAKRLEKVTGPIVVLNV